MPPVTTIALKALDHLSGSKIILAAIPGGIRALAREAGVSPGRVSQVLRKDALPREWARLIAQMIGCGEWEVYQQLGQQPQSSPLGPLFDLVGPPSMQNPATDRVSLDRGNDDG